MDLLAKSDEEIFAIAKPIWENLVKSSNLKDYGGFTRDFSTQMLFGANEVELGKQWANNKILEKVLNLKSIIIKASIFTGLAAYWSIILVGTLITFS